MNIIGLIIIKWKYRWGQQPYYMIDVTSYKFPDVLPDLKRGPVPFYSVVEMTSCLVTTLVGISKQERSTGSLVYNPIVEVTIYSLHVPCM